MHPALWITIALIALAMIGLGVGTFFSGVVKGVQQLGSLPVVNNAAEEIKQYIHNATESIRGQK